MAGMHIGQGCYGSSISDYYNDARHRELQKQREHAAYVQRMELEDRMLAIQSIYGLQEQLNASAHAPAPDTTPDKRLLLCLL